MDPSVFVNTVGIKAITFIFVKRKTLESSYFFLSKTGPYTRWLQGGFRTLRNNLENLHNLYALDSLYIYSYNVCSFIFIIAELLFCILVYVLLLINTY